MDERLDRLTEWLHARPELDACEITPASEDASFRRYFRVRRGNRTWIAMDAPPGKEDTGPFLKVAALFGEIGLNVPRVFDADTEQGFLLLSDLGSELYLPALAGSGAAERLYGDALDALVTLQAGGAGRESALPPYDEALLRREAGLFTEWYLGRHLGIALSDEQNEWFGRAEDLLVARALEQPRVWVHRDYHSRNLLVTATHNPGILDFQDAVCGPVAYDVVSLLKDCYISWPRAQLEAWVAGFHRRGREAGLPVGDSPGEFLRWTDLMGVQRHLKAIGIFARLHHRDGKAGFLADIPRVLAYVRDCCSRYPELAPLGRLLPAVGAPS